MKFEFNDCDVCINPEVIYKSEPLKLAWNYIEIEIATDGKKWDYGYSRSCGGSPCSPIHGKHDTKESCVQDAIDFMYADCLTVVNTEKDQKVIIIANQYLDWYNSRNQLTLF